MELFSAAEAVGKMGEDAKKRKAVYDWMKKKYDLYEKNYVKNIFGGIY
jgi:hypothetical protein